MKSVPNSISYLHIFSRNFSQLLAICFELFSSRSVFNSENADARGALVIVNVVQCLAPIGRAGRHCPTPFVSSAAHFVEAELCRSLSSHWPWVLCTGCRSSSARRQPQLTTHLSPFSHAGHYLLPPPLQRACHDRTPLFRWACASSVRPPHLLSVCCVPSTRAAIAGAVPCRHAVRASVPVLWVACAGPVQMGRMALYHGPRPGNRPTDLVLLFYFLNIFKFLQIQKFV
jgi:hypothetical protein